MSRATAVLTALAAALATTAAALLSFQRTRSGTNWMKGKSFKRLAHTGHLKRSDSRTLSPGSSPASTHSSVGPRGQHRGAFFRASVANLDA